MYPQAEYALLPQTANGTGANRWRHCDALAMSLWPSRGLEVSGFEIKCYRGDWLREKANPAKAEDFAKFCHRWWIVTSGPFVEADELPEPWGLMVWDKETKALKVTKKAKHVEALPLDGPLIAAILRKAQDVCTPDAEIQEAKSEGYKAGLEKAALDATRDKEDLKKLRDRLAVVEKKSGVKIETWQPAENIGDALNAILNGTQQRQVESLRRLAGQIAIEFGIEESHLSEDANYKLSEMRRQLKMKTRRQA